MKRRGVLLLLQFITILTFTQFVSCSKDQPIRLGFISSLSGRLSSMGVTARNGAELAVIHANERGGINGRKIELVTKDDMGDSKSISPIVDQFLSEGIGFIIGPSTSNMALPITHSIKGKNILSISPTISTDKVKDLDDNFLRICSSPRGQAETLFNDIKNIGYKRVAFIYDISNKEYTETVQSVFKQLFEEIGGSIAYENDLSDKSKLEFRNIATKVKDEDIPAVILVTSGIDGATITQQIHKSGFPTQIFGTSWLKTNDFITHGGKSVEGVRIVSIFEAKDKSEEYKRFSSDFERIYHKKPSFVSVYNYDATNILIESIRKTGSEDPNKIKEYIIERSKFHCLEEEVGLNRFGDAVRDHILFVVKDGKYQILDK